MTIDLLLSVSCAHTVRIRLSNDATVYDHYSYCYFPTLYFLFHRLTSKQDGARSIIVIKHIAHTPLSPCLGLAFGFQVGSIK